MIASIRFLHTSDWHLGRVIYGQSLIEDQSFALERLVELVDTVQPHALLIAGDVFDRALPPENAIALFNSFLNEVALKRKLPIFLIPGNHDSAERVGFAADLLRGQNVTIFARLQESRNPVLVRGDGDACVWMYGIPFVEPAEMAAVLQQDLRSPDEATRAFCKSLLESRKDSRPAVLLCHAFVVGGEVSDSEKEIYIGGSSQVEASAFTGFHYVALGHLHKPQPAGRETIRYSGSLLPYSKSEVGHEKSITEIELGPHGDLLNVRLHPIRARRGLRYIEGSIEELLAMGAQDSKPDDYIIAGFTDTGAVLEAFAKIRLVYPNLLHVARAGAFTPESLPALIKEREAMSDLELFTEFFRDSTGQELNDEERESLIQILSESERSPSAGGAP